MNETETSQPDNAELGEAKSGAPPGYNPNLMPPSPPERSVHLNFSKTRKGSPFQKAKSLDKRLKLFLWGDSGAGKTTLALQFPKPVVIDMERGTDLYGESFDFDVLRATTAVSRARGVCVLVGQREEVSKIIKRNRQQRRFTRLAELLQEMSS